MGEEDFCQRDMAVQLYESILPDHLQEILVESIKNPPQLIADGPLSYHRRDHVALAVPDYSEAFLVEKYLENSGVKTLDKLKLWPDEYKPGFKLPTKFKKYMGVYDIGPEYLVLLAPYYSDDLIARKINEATGEPAIHHLAYQVEDLLMIHDFSNLEDCQIKTLSEIVVDAGKLSQVFIQVDDDPRIVELIKRWPDFNGTFTYENIKQLTEGEAKS